MLTLAVAAKDGARSLAMAILLSSGPRAFYLFFFACLVALLVAAHAHIMTPILAILLVFMKRTFAFLFDATIISALTKNSADYNMRVVVEEREECGNFARRV